MAVDLSYHDRVVRYMTEGQGMVEIASNSTRYRTFMSKSSVQNRTIYRFVGVRGAVRQNSVHRSSDAYSISYKVSRAMLAWENEQGLRLNIE